MLMRYNSNVCFMDHDKRNRFVFLGCLSDIKQAHLRHHFVLWGDERAIDDTLTSSIK